MNKRLHVRRKWRTKIILENEFGEGLVYFYSRDISLGGLFLDNPPPLKLGAHLFLSFVLPGKKRPLHLVGEVVRFVERDLGKKEILHAGAGVRFVDIDSKTRCQIADFIQRQ